MSNSVNIICAVCGVLFGTAAAYVNLHISRSGIKADSVAGIMGRNMARLLVDIICLGITFLVCKIFDLPLVVSLIAVAFGLTVCGMFMLRSLVKDITEEIEKETDGGE